jgi:hypothetical protein
MTRRYFSFRLKTLSVGMMRKSFLGSVIHLLRVMTFPDSYSVKPIVLSVGWLISKFFICKVMLLVSLKTSRTILTRPMNPIFTSGKFHDQGDAKWIVIRGQLRGHNDTPCGRPAPGRPISRPGSGCPQGVIGVFSYY